MNGTVATYDVVVNASYSNFNQINKYLGLPLKKILYEDVIIPSFAFLLDKIGITIMDGPFCSIMPNGKNKNEFLLYHVKHSVISSDLSYTKPNFASLKKDYENEIHINALEFMPFIKDVRKLGYERVTRAVHENSDDARLTELHTYKEIDKYFAVLSGKVSTCIQVALEIKHSLQGKKTSKPFII